MRISIRILISLLFAAICHGQAMFFGGNVATGGGTSIAIVAQPACVGNASAAVISANTVGSTLFVLAITSQAGAASITDSANSNWSTRVAMIGAGPATELWYLENPNTSSSETITVNGSFAGACFMAFSGTLTSSSLESSTSNTVSGPTTIKAGSVTPGSGNQLIITNFGDNTIGSAGSVDSGFTISSQITEAPGVNYTAGIAYKIQVGGAPADPQWTVTGAPTIFSAINAVFQGS